MQLLNTYATNSDFTVDLNGEFSPNAAGGTPFGAFPMQFPPSTGRMAEILVSDFTVNSLFYHLHRYEGEGLIPIYFLNQPFLEVLKD